MRTQLAVLEAQVLGELCKAKVTASAVSMAADMPDGGMDYQLAEFVMEGLNAMGLITYRLGAFDVFVEIRVTKWGFEAMGYEWHSQIGSAQSRMREGARHPGDRTDFRTHNHYAEVTESHRCSLDEHLGEFPDHRYTTRGGF